MATRQKISLDPNFREFIELLNSRGVRYLLIGGYAVNFHGHHRSTEAIDFWIAVDQQNAELVTNVLHEFGFDLPEIRPERFLETGRVHVFGREPVRFDLLTSPAGVEFDDCYSRRTVATLDGAEVPVISFDDLIRNKEASGRDQDILDVKKLKRRNG